MSDPFATVTETTAQIIPVALTANMAQSFLPKSKQGTKTKVIYVQVKPAKLPKMPAPKKPSHDGYHPKAKAKAQSWGKMRKVKAGRHTGYTRKRR